MSFWKWSRTAATNASADGSINWAEGQPPSSVNDSARAMMAAASKYRDDIAGAIATGGTSTAYTVTSYQVFDTLAHMDGAMIAFTPHTTNGATVTLNVDGLGAKPLRSAPSVELQTGALIQGTPYLALYNNSDAAWYLHGASNYNSYACPLAGSMVYFGSSAPNSAFAFPYGQAISRTTYATLFIMLGSTYGAGDGVTTFNLPDLRGRVPAGLDNMGGSSAARLSVVISSSTLGASGGAQNQTIAQANMPNINWPVTDTHRHFAEASDQGYSGLVGLTNGTNVNTINGTGATVPAVTGTSQNFQNLQSTLTSLTGSGSIVVSTGGSGTALPTTQPTIMVNYIMRII